MKVLLIENDEAIVAQVVDSLLAQSHLVNTAAKGETGLALAHSFAYDLVLLDEGLPDLDGISVCRQLRDQGHQMPIVLLTSQDSSDRHSGLEAGATDYLIKPFESEELLSCIQAL
jgi:DNA-binding response OmpR family regulator